MLLLLLTGSAWGGEPFVIQVIDQQTRRGVPLVQLRLTTAQSYYTDSQGVVAFDEPGLMDRQVYFHVESDGYEMPADGFGFRGRTVVTRPGGRATFELKRTTAGERLYRVTGAGIYRDSIRAGMAVPIEQPVLNAEVTGCDSVLNAVYRGKIYWFWGDTNRIRYPLGNFHVPGGVSELRSSLGPQDGVNLKYFVDDDGFAKSVARMPGEGPTWIDSLLVLDDETGQQVMLAEYLKVRPPLSVYERGLCRWNDEAEQFEHLVTFPLDAPALPSGHALRVSEDDGDYFYFCHPFPLVRVPADVQAIIDPNQYESLTCLQSGVRWQPQDKSTDLPLERDAQGRLAYAWKHNTSPASPALEAHLVRTGQARVDEVLLQLRDRETGKAVLAHHGSVQWNAYRDRWIMLCVEHFGTSVLGEIWLAEADTLAGPWAYAVKVATHTNYSFYNPKLHPMFDQQDGQLVYFEGTYTHTFSGNPHPTPWYDYNQIMYRLDLGPDEPRTALPVALRQDAAGRWHRGIEIDGDANPLDALRQVTLFALERPQQGTVALAATRDDATRLVLSMDSQRSGRPSEPGEHQQDEALFYAWPNKESAPTACVGLYEYRLADGSYRYATHDDVMRPGWEASTKKPLCYVWPAVHGTADP